MKILKTIALLLIGAAILLPTRLQAEDPKTEIQYLSGHGPGSWRISDLKNNHFAPQRVSTVRISNTRLSDGQPLGGKSVRLGYATADFPAEATPPVTPTITSGHGKHPQAGLRWANLETRVGRLTVASASPEGYLRVGSARISHEGTTVAFPAGDFSFLHAIPQIGSKIDHHSPSSQPSMANGDYHGTLTFTFADGRTDGVSKAFERPQSNATGFKKILIKPAVVSGLEWVECSYQSPFGKITSNWRKREGKLVMEVTIPPNTTARVSIPTKDIGPITESGKPVEKSTTVTFLRMENNTAVYEISSGHYEFKTVSPL